MSKIRLSKDERRALLARIERESSRAESPARVLQRAEQALADGNLGQARRLVQQLESSAPQLGGLVAFKEKLTEAEKREKAATNIRITEEMLVRYIQQRQKQMAEFALETLVNIAPNHPRRSDYETWVRDLDQEVVLQKQIDEQLLAGRTALQAGDMDETRRRLEALRRLDPDAPGTVQLAKEMTRVRRGQAASADIGRIKEKVEELLAEGKMDEAEKEVERLGHHDVPKITLDFLHKRLDEARSEVRNQEETAALDADFQSCLEAGDWAGARDAAHRFGARFPTSNRAAEMFGEVNDAEGTERRQHSIQQGIAALEQFIVEKKRGAAELALKLLKNKLEPDELALFERRVRDL